MGVDEIFDVVDESGKKIGRATRAEVHSDPSGVEDNTRKMFICARGKLYYVYNT